MSAFLAAAHLDCFELVGSLRTRLGLFKAPERGALVCPVRQWRGEKWMQAPYVASWPELTNTLKRIAHLGESMGGIEFGEVWLTLLRAGTCMDWQQGGDDDGDYEHAILVLRTSPAVTFFAGAEVAAPGIGFLTMVSRRLPRSAINLGADAAIWLAADFRKHQEKAQ